MLIVQDGKVFSIDPILQLIRNQIDTGHWIPGGLIRNKHQEVTGRFPASSTYPEYFKRKGYSKRETLAALDKVLGDKLTDRQLELVTELYESSGFGLLPWPVEEAKCQPHHTSER